MPHLSQQEIDRAAMPMVIGVRARLEALLQQTEHLMRKLDALAQHQLLADTKEVSHG